MPLTLPTAYPPLRALIDAKAIFAGLPPFHADRYHANFLPGEWLEALIMTESSGNARARRYEPHQDRATRTDAAADPDTCDVDDGDIEDDSSYGLCQVMGYNLRALFGGLLVKPVLTANRWKLERAGASEGIYAPMSFAWAFHPDVNITAGILVLQGELAAVGNDVERALARYNGGPTGDDVVLSSGGDMRLRAYVDRVVGWADKIAAERVRIGWPVRS